MNWAGAGDSAFSPRGFLARGLTAGAAVSYIALTKGGSPMGVAGFVDFSAIAGTFGAVLLVLGVFVSGWAGSLTLLMEGRETQAAWLCGSGGFVPGALCFGFGAIRTKERWLCFESHALRFGTFGFLGWRARFLVNAATARWLIGFGREVIGK